MKEGMTFRVCAFLPIVAGVLSRATFLVADGQLPSKSHFAPILCLEASTCEESVELDPFFREDDETGFSGSFDAYLFSGCPGSGLPYSEGHLSCRIDRLGGRLPVFLIAPKNDPPACV